MDGIDALQIYIAIAAGIALFILVLIIALMAAIFNTSKEATRIRELLEEQQSNNQTR